MSKIEGGTATWVLRQVDDDVGTLRVVDGPDRGLTRSFDRPALRIGSAPEADVQLADRSVSKLHCELAASAGRVRVRDLGSKNGTWIAGCRIVEAEAPVGTRLQIGASTLEIGVERKRVPRPVWTGGPICGGLVGTSPAMQRLFAVVERLAGSAEPVLIRGESGTGKELIARALHERGPRRERPFVIVDGAALSRSLAEVELFGHARGAFTGAHVARAGALERADGGTVFVDEIGEVPLELQPKLLRFLEEGTVQRLGDAGRKRVEARVVAATHRPLERMVNDGTFREDLFHRLAVVEIRVPPLRERREDVDPIARHHLEQLAPGDRDVAGAVARELAARARHSWPGNVRELRNLVRRAVALGGLDPGEIAAEPSEAPAALATLAGTMAEAKQHAVEAFERAYLSRLLAETGGNISEAARRADVDRGHLGRLVAKYGLRR